jgi:TolA-binding protein
MTILANRLIQITAILAALIVAFGPGVSGQALQNEAEAFEYAQRLLSDDLYSTAAQEFRRFVLNFPTSERIPQARFRLADAHYQAEEWVRAIETFESFISRHPEHLEVAGAMRNRARSLERTGDHARAGAAFRELHDRFRAGEYAAQDLLSSGSNYDQAGMTAEAESGFKELITRHTSSPLINEASYTLGLVLLRVGRTQEALGYFEAIRSSEREPDARLEIGRVALAGDDFGRAETVFDDLRKRFPNSRAAEQSYLATAGWYDDREQWSDAAKVYEQARRVLPRNERRQRAVIGLAESLRKSGGEALSLYAEFLKAYPQSPFVAAARLGLGRAFADRGRYREATEALSLLQEQFPSHPLAWESFLHLGNVWKGVGDARKALAAYKEGLEQNEPSIIRSHIQLAIGELYRDDLAWFDQAIDELRPLANHDDRGLAASAQFALAKTYEVASRHQTAVREYQLFLERFPDAKQAPEAEKRLMLVRKFATTSPVDQPMLVLLSDLAGTTSTTARKVGQYLFNHRHYALASEVFEAMAKRDSLQQSEAWFWAGRSFESLFDKSRIEGTTHEPYEDRARAAYSEVLKAPNNEWSDDAAVRLVELDHVEGLVDTAAAACLLSAYERLAKLYPKSDLRPFMVLRRADAHFAMGSLEQTTEALTLYRTVIGRYPGSVASERATYGVGRCLAQQQAYAEAENVLRDFLFTYPGSTLASQVRFQLGVILLERGFVRSATDEFAQLLEAPSSLALDKSGRVLLAECYYRQEHFSKAIEIDEQLLARDPGPDVWRRLAASHKRSGNHNRALSVYLDFERRFPDYGAVDTVAFDRASLLAEMGRPDEAIAAFDRFTRTYKTSRLVPGATRAVADLQYNAGHYDQAWSAYNKMPESALDIDAQGRRVVSLFRLDRIKAATKEGKSFAKKHKNAKEWNARFAIEEGRFQLRANHPKNAQKILAKVSEDFKGTDAVADAEYYLIKALSRGGNSEAHFTALVRFVKNHDNSPHWSSANLELAAIYSRDEDYAGASRAYLNALNNGLSSDQRPAVFEKLYKTHRNLRLYDSAVGYARDLVQSYPSHALAREARIQIGDLLKEKGAHVEAIDELSPVLKDLSGDDWSIAQNIIAESHQLMGDYDGALREYLKLVYNHQGSANWIATAHMGRARSFEAQERQAEAIAELEKIRAKFGATSAFGLQAGNMIDRLRLDRGARD